MPQPPPTYASECVNYSQLFPIDHQNNSKNPGYDWSMFLGSQSLVFWVTHYAIRTEDLRAQENSLFQWKTRKKGYGFLSYRCRIPVRHCLTYVCSGLRELAMPAQKPRSHGAIFRHS